MGAPVLRTWVPRTRPSEEDMATVLTRLSPRCCCVSKTSLVLLGICGLVGDFDGVVDVGHGAFVELGIDDGTDDLDDFASVRIFVWNDERFGESIRRQAAKAAAEIS